MMLIPYFLTVTVLSSVHSLSVYETTRNGVTRTELLDSKGSKVAWAIFDNKINQTGWSFLEVYSNGNYPNSQQAYSAGWVEGYATRDLITMHWINMFGEGYCKNQQKFCDALNKYLQENTKWIQSQIESEPGNPYWEQVKLYYYQTSGLIDGYKNVTGQPRFDIDLASLFLFQIDGDLDDLQTVLKNQGVSKQPGEGHCSAMVKLLPGNKDLYVSQDTWTEYQQMLRILKKYELPFYLTDSGKAFVPVQAMTFSSYPGSLTSGDDFYVLSSHMVSMETTIGNGNSDLWKYVTPQGTVFEGIRSMVANRLAVSGAEWSALFEQYNSGTYNNQWMVVDYKKFTPGQDLVDGLFYVVEQIPGMVVSQDLTKTLKEKSYFGSYNIPYFPSVFNASGGPEAVKKYGGWFSYEYSPRAQIFARDHVKVKDTDSMTKLMRYNNFQNDPLSKCNCTPPYSAENAISARCDLNPINGTYPFSALGHRAHGGIDMKLTTYSLHKTLDFIAVSSPTYDDVPAFQWSKSDYDKKLSHIGHPDMWMFKPIQTEW